MDTPMTSTTFARRDTAAAAPATRAVADRTLDDKAMLRAAADLTRELHKPNPAIYWTDFVGSVTIGYAALGTAMLWVSPWAIVVGVVAVLALYRAGSFIHEITHMKASSVPGFRLGWNLLFGIPMMMPSFMYEGVHNLHHARTRYGTSEDPEYLPLALMKPWTLPLFVVTALLAPIALVLRYAVLVPLALVIPRLRTWLVEQASSLAINPGFRRRPAEGEARTRWLWLEGATSVWAIALVAMVATGVVPLRAVVIFLGIYALSTLLNQVRTLVAHLWENEGEAMSVTAQYLDSVNVPPPSYLPFLWAPVGLRYHALHHLVPSVPYHALGEAHRRLVAVVGDASPYHGANHAGLSVLVPRLVRSTMGRR
jgi:fatty acid desaturase